MVYYEDKGVRMIDIDQDFCYEHSVQNIDQDMQNEWAFVTDLLLIMSILFIVQDDAKSQTQRRFLIFATCRAMFPEYFNDRGPGKTWEQRIPQIQSMGTSSVNSVLPNINANFKKPIFMVHSYGKRLYQKFGNKGANIDAIFAAVIKAFIGLSQKLSTLGFNETQTTDLETHVILHPDASLDEYVLAIEGKVGGMYKPRVSSALFDMLNLYMNGMLDVRKKREGEEREKRMRIATQSQEKVNSDKLMAGLLDLDFSAKTSTDFEQKIPSPKMDVSAGALFGDKTVPLSFERSNQEHRTSGRRGFFQTDWTKD